MITFYVPDVKGVKEWINEDVAAASDEQLKKLEEKIASKNKDL